MDCARQTSRGEEQEKTGVQPSKSIAEEAEIHDVEQDKTENLSRAETVGPHR